MSVSDMCLTRERLGHGCLRVRGVSSRKIILFYSGHGRDTFQTRLRHSNVKLKKIKKKRRNFASWLHQSHGDSQISLLVSHVLLPALFLLHVFNFFFLPFCFSISPIFLLLLAVLNFSSVFFFFFLFLFL